MIQLKYLTILLLALVVNAHAQHVSIIDECEDLETVVIHRRIS